MLTHDQARDRAHDLVARAIKAGADAADAIYVADASTGVQVRLGALEDVQRSEGEEIGLRVFVGRQSASASSSDLSLDALTKLAERAVAMAGQAPEDEYAGLAPAELLMRETPRDLDIDDGADVSPQALRERAMAAEDAARAVTGVTNSEGGSASAGRAIIALATSGGFAGSYSGSSHSVSASVLAGEGAGMQRDYAYHSVRHLGDLDDATAIGREAGDKAVARLNPIKLKSGPMTVVLDPRVGGSLVGHLIGAIAGSSIARKTSFLLDALGTEVFAPNITIWDDPHRLRGLRSKPFDGEGLPTSRRALIDKGVLTTWLLDSASARQLGLQPTGHAARGVGGPPGAGASNLHMEAGSLSPADLMADIKEGFYVTELIGQGVNGLTGDYSRGASGFVIRNGHIAEAVAEVTIAGNLKDMFRNLTPANDLTFRYGTNVPTLRLEGLMLAGD
ncbi:MAG: TldD/PmbA family protein [Alphaproteobacteria bacterium]|nr:TldD/PmbA family protein [Alphaproteobacteria bacterium]